MPSETAPRIVSLSNIDSSVTLLTALNCSVEAMEFKVDPKPAFQEPPKVLELRELIWGKFLEEAWANIAPENRDKYKIASPENSTNGLPALVLADTGKQRVWAGETVMGKTLEISGDKAVITLTPTNYSVIHALDSNAYRFAMETTNGFVPTAGFGMCTLVKSADGDLVFTYRPPDTAVYGNRVHPAGGHPRPEHTPIQAVIEELEEELGIKAGAHYKSSNVKALAISVDNNYRGSGCSRPEMITYVETSLTTAQIVECFEERKRSKGQEPDVSRLVFASEAAVLSGEAVRDGQLLVRRHNSDKQEWIRLTPSSAPAMEHYGELTRSTLGQSQANVRTTSIGPATGAQIVDGELVRERNR